MRRSIPFAVLLASLVGANKTPAQDSGTPVIDSISITAYNVFRPSEASNFLFRIANGVRFTTRTAVIARELLFHEGDPYDSATVAETARNLRRLPIFRRVTIDSVTVGEKLVINVVTDDAWSTQFQFNLRTTGSEVTGSVALSEVNFLGRGNLAEVAYRDEPDRTAVTLQTQIRRMFGTRFRWGVLYDNLSDGHIVAWNAGLPFMSDSEDRAAVVQGSSQQRRVLRFRDGVVADSLQKRTFQNNLIAALATSASSRGYVRFGFLSQIRREEYVAFQDTGSVIPDSVTAAVGVYADIKRSRYMVVTHYNGFNREEEINLSTRVVLEAWLAPSAFGYRRTGIGPALTVRTGASRGKFFTRIWLEANGLFTSVGLDSGQVAGSVTLGSKALERHATVLHVAAGARRRPPFAQDYDLGHGLGPRAFEPHSFTGDRTVWGILEHRWFVVDEVLGLFGIGIAGFLDYGGAWFNDQPARFGGNVGMGLRLGNTRSSGANTGRFDLSYRFGEGFTGSRWVFSLGRAFPF